MFFMMFGRKEIKQKKTKFEQFQEPIKLSGILLFIAASQTNDGRAQPKHTILMNMAPLILASTKPTSEPTKQPTTQNN